MDNYRYMRKSNVEKCCCDRCSGDCCCIQGPVGPAGPQGPQGPRGVQGPAGEKGAAGPAGTDGLAATISVESAGRVPFDDNPYVENVGTSQNAILRFGIPSGMPGAQGAQGQKGDKGDKGERGEQGPAGEGFSGVYAYLYGKGLQRVKSNSDVVFNQPQIPSQLPEGIAFNAPSEITISSPGVYEVAYYLGNPSLLFALMLNGQEIEGTRCPRGAYNYYTLWQSLIVVEAGSIPAILTLRNIDRNQDVTIGEYVMSPEESIIASLLIKKIG